MGIGNVIAGCNCVADVVRGGSGLQNRRRRFDSGLRRRLKPVNQQEAEMIKNVTIARALKEKNWGLLQIGTNKV